MTEKIQLRTHLLIILEDDTPAEDAARATRDGYALKQTERGARRNRHVRQVPAIHARKALDRIAVHYEPIYSICQLPEKRHSGREERAECTRARAYHWARRTTWV